MRMPFTVEQFLDVFARYNAAIWPAQLAAYALGALVVAIALRGGPAAARAVPILLAGAWAFVGVGYHVVFFAPVNPIAHAFGAAFVLEAALLAWAGVSGRVAFGWSRTPRCAVGLALVAYAAAIYPLLGLAAGHGYPGSPTFGVTPCPTTIFTFGVLLLTEGRVPARLLVVPGLWALLGVSAALQLGIREDLGLLVAAVAATALLLAPASSKPRAAAS